MQPREFLLFILAIVAKVGRAIGGLELAAVVIGIHRTVVDLLECWDVQNWSCMWVSKQM